MNHVTDLFSFRLSADPDTRARRNLLPCSVVMTQGNVEGAGILLKDHPVQVFMGKRETCVLSNRSGTEKAGILLDFGRELHGNIRLTVSDVTAPGGRANVRIRFGESAMEALAPVGYRNSTNDHATRDHVYDIGMLSTTETNESGFRFVYIQLEDESASISIQAIHMCFIYRDIPYLGSFRCSDPLLEQIWKTAAYTVHLNMQNYLWDGIKRDRLAWQGDMHTEVMTITNVFGANPVVPKTLDFLRDGTDPKSWINGYSSYSLWWIIVQAHWYRYTGDLAYLREQKEFLKAQAALAASCVDDNGSECLPEFRFLDWPNLNDPDATHAGLQGLMCLALKEAAYLLSILEDHALADICRTLAGRMENHVPDCGNSKQAAALLSLSGLADPERTNREVLSPGGSRGYSTFMGYYILAAKAKAGDWEGALRDIREYWGGMLKMGATTFWEDFDLSWLANAAGIDEITPQGKTDIHGSYGGFCYSNYRHSLCHGWASGPVPFLTGHILGISIAEPGCKKLTVAPHLGFLTYASGTFPTPLGIVRVSHSLLPDGTVQTVYDAPEGIEIILC